jgi:hypothetical protein
MGVRMPDQSLSIGKTGRGKGSARSAEEPRLAVVGTESVSGEGGGGNDAVAGRDNKSNPPIDPDQDDAFLPGLAESRGLQWLPPSAWAVRVVAAITPLLARTMRPMRRTILIMITLSFLDWSRARLAVVASEGVSGEGVAATTAAGSEDQRNPLDCLEHFAAPLGGLRIGYL